MGLRHKCGDARTAMPCRSPRVGLPAGMDGAPQPLYAVPPVVAGVVVSPCDSMFRKKA